METFENILVSKKDSLGLITINRPEKLNAISGATRDEIMHAMELLQADPEVRALVFSGAGNRAFSSGQDLTEARSMDSEAARKWITQWETFDEKLLNSKVPTVAMIKGYCMGAGFQITLYMDIRIAAANAVFGLPEVDSAIPCIAGTYMVGGTVGLGRVAPLVLLGERVPAAEAAQMGLVHKVVPTENLEAETMRIASSLASKDPTALALMREWRSILMNRWFGMSISEMREVAREYHARAFGKGGPQRGMDAFLANKK